MFHLVFVSNDVLTTAIPFCILKPLLIFANAQGGGGADVLVLQMM